jgi:hypothetical protein
MTRILDDTLLDMVAVPGGPMQKLVNAGDRWCHDDPSAALAN